MKTYKKVTVPAYEREVLDGRKCDLCGMLGKGESSWNGGYYEVNETEITVTIKQKEGESYPEGGSGTEYNVDLCPNCFKDKLIPWLNSQGANLKEQDWCW